MYIHILLKKIRYVYELYCIFSYQVSHGSLDTAIERNSECITPMAAMLLFHILQKIT
jgi:hypothetical protein